MSKRQDEIAKKAVRKSTMKCLKVKKQARLNQLKEEYNENVRQIEIQYAEDPEMLKAKFAAEDFAAFAESSKNPHPECEALRAFAHGSSWENSLPLRNLHNAPGQNPPHLR